jgi:hypothetical protein
MKKYWELYAILFVVFLALVAIYAFAIHQGK